MDNGLTSIRDRDAPRPIKVTPDKSADTIIPLILLIVIIVFLVWMLVLLIMSGFQTTSPENPVATDNRSVANNTFICPPGQCATNLLSGFKTCPTDNGLAVPFNPQSEVCNDRFLCTNPLTPFAVQSDGSTNINGVCEPNTACPCVNQSRCPEYILSAFTTRNGNPYVSLDGQRITFPQISNYVDNNGEIIDTPPIQYRDPATTFCSAPMAWLPFANPGCNFIPSDRANSMTYDDILICMGLPNQCDGGLGNACLSGTLSYITDNPESLTQQNIDRAQVGCVRGDPCPCGMASIYDTNFGGIVCRDIPVN